MIDELNERARAVLRLVVDSYMETGEPVGSRTLSRSSGLDLSPATIRNVMADLEEGGLLFAPHTSAGRLPTQRGMRLYIDGLMEIGRLNDEEQRAIEAQFGDTEQSVASLLGRASSLLSGLSAAAGLVVAPKTDKPVKSIQFVRIEQRRVLVVLVLDDHSVENRVMECDADITPSSLEMAANYLNERLSGKSLAQMRDSILHEIGGNRSRLDALSADLVRRGIAVPSTSGAIEGHIVIRGQAKLLQDVRALEDIARARDLLAALEEQETAARLLDAVQDAEGAQIFIGTENRMFGQAGWSMVIAPYCTPEKSIIGAIGVIGPVRLNYGRIIPLVDYTAQVVGRMMGKQG